MYICSFWNDLGSVCGSGSYLVFYHIKLLKNTLQQQMNISCQENAKD